MANSVDPDQTAPIGAVCSGSTLFATILNLTVMLGKFAADDFSRQHFQMHFFGALRVKNWQITKNNLHTVITQHVRIKHSQYAKILCLAVLSILIDPDKDILCA